MMNQIFGYQTLPEDEPSDTSSFKGTELVIPSGNIDINDTQVKLFARPNTHLHSCFSQQYETYCYVWGIPAHPEIDSTDIPKWCIRVVAEKCYNEFKNLVGTFVVIIDEPRQNRLTFVTDILGIRPMFLGKHENRIVFGSDVWSIHQAGLTSGVIDYDSVSAWIAYGFNCTDGSLFSDLRRLPPGSVIVLQDEKFIENPYAEFESKDQILNDKQVFEEIHQIVLTTVKMQLSNHSKVSIPLSGGYDSRYLLALSLSLGRASIDCATVSLSEEEGSIAHKVAETLRVPLKNYPVNGSIWDLYDQVYHFMADGFPISKFVPYRIAQDYQGIPMINGFMGDALIRGDSDTFMGKYETEWKENLVDVLQRKHLKIPFRILRKEMIKKIQLRSRPPMERALSEGSKLGKVFGWQDFFYTHRFYISNNFLQHIGLAEVLLPFYSWELLSYKMKHAYKIFNMDTYRRIYQRYFPKLVSIPHSSDLKPKITEPYGVAQCTKLWAKQLIPVIVNKNKLSLIKKKNMYPNGYSRYWWVKTC